MIKFSKGETVKIKGDKKEYVVSRTHKKYFVDGLQKTYVLLTEINDNQEIREVEDCDLIHYNK